MRTPKRIEREIEMRTRHAKELQESVNEVERISGVKISSWNSEAIGKAVRAVMAAGVTGTYGNLDSLRRQAETIVKHCDEALTLFAADTPEPQL